MEEVNVLRINSSRPVYRRGGLELSHTPIDIRKGQDGGILSPEAMLALLLDPIVHLRVSEDGDNFRLMTEAERQEVAENLQALLDARSAVVKSDTKIPDGLGPDTASEPVPGRSAAADQAKAGEVKDASAADTKAASEPAAGEDGRSAGADVGEKVGGDMAATTATAEENNGGVDGAPAPVAAAVPAPKPAKAGKGRGSTKKSGVGVEQPGSSQGS